MKKIFIIISIVVLLLFINNLIYNINLNEDKIEDFKEIRYKKSNSDEYILPKVIYGFWDDLDTNLIIQSHIKNWRKKISKDWEIIILNKDNVYKYVDSEFLNRYGSGHIDSTRFSDFLRVYLLIKNGGCWIDASIFIIDGQFLDKYYDEMVENEYDACFYEYKEQTMNELQPHIDNWFMMAPKNSNILIDLYNEFDKAFEMDFLKYKNDILVPSGILLDKTIGYDDSTYLLQHAIFHYLFKKGNKYNIVLKNATESMYKIQEIFTWDHEKVLDYVIYNDDWTGFYGIKLTKGNRSVIKDEKVYIDIIDNF
jgi:hypothetical protein